MKNWIIGGLAVALIAAGWATGHYREAGENAKRERNQAQAEATRAKTESAKSIEKAIEAEVRESEARANADNLAATARALRDRLRTRTAEPMPSLPSVDYGALIPEPEALKVKEVECLVALNAAHDALDAREIQANECATAKDYLKASLEAQTRRAEIQERATSAAVKEIRAEKGKKIIYAIGALGLGYLAGRATR